VRAAASLASAIDRRRDLVRARSTAALGFRHSKSQGRHRRVTARRAQARALCILGLAEDLLGDNGMRPSAMSRCNSIVSLRGFLGLVASTALIAAPALAGCDDPDLVRHLGSQSSSGQAGSASGAGGRASGSGGAVASGNGGSGAGGAGGCAGGVGDAGSAGGTSAVGVCSAFDLSPSFELAPSAPGQNYVRCQTLGPEAGWQEIAIAADGQHVAARTGAGTVRLIATNPWHEVAQIASPLGVLDAMAFAPDGQLLAVLSAEMGEVSVWRSGDGTRVASFATPSCRRWRIRLTAPSWRRRWAR
jgi:hypothetical protein